MNKKNVSAVQISAGLKISRKASQSLSPIIIKYLIVFSGCLGSVFCLLSCVDIPAAPLAAVLTAVFACGIFTFVFGLGPKLSGIASTGAAAVFLAAVFLLRYEICAGIANTVDIYLARVRETFRVEPFILIAEPELASVHVTIAVCFYTALLCMITAYFASRSSFSMGICISVLIFPVAVLMFGLKPNYAAFGAVVAVCAASLALENSSPEKISSGKCEYASTHSGLAAAVTALLCFAIVTAVVELGGYERSERIDEIYDSFTGYVESGEMKNAVSEILTIAVKNPGQSGAINHGKLGEFDEITFDNKVILQVTMPKSKDTIYLRGFVGSVYTGRSWKELPEEGQKTLEQLIGNFSTDGLSPLLFDSYSLRNAPSTYYSSYNPALPQHSFSINNVAGGRNYLYMPYNLVPESVARYTIQGDSTFAGGESSYIGQFYDPSGNYGYQNLFKVRWQSLNTSLTADEAQYRNFVYTYYMGLPDKFTAAESIFNDDYYEYITNEEVQTGKSTLDEMTVFSRKLYYIKNWLRSNCTYSLSAGKLPAGEDFVENFLKNKRGSCSHFASTAALMCRYAGIPARYVEGYIIKPGDFSDRTPYGESASVNVTDYRGHAWVEIYIDGYGWYPMEFTSGYGNVRTALPTETVTETVTETELADESESAEESEDLSEPAETTVPEEAAPQPAGENSAAASSAETTLTGNGTVSTEVTTVPAADSEAEATVQTEPAAAVKPSVGFSVFGLGGGSQTDIVYDITVPVIVIIAILLVPVIVMLRRRFTIAVYQHKCALGERSAVFASYKKFGRILKIMKLPEQGGLDYSEYAEMLSLRSNLLADGTAKTVIGTALKAYFGGSMLTSEDVEKSVQAVNTLTKYYYASLPKYDRFFFKYIYCMI